MYTCQRCGYNSPVKCNFQKHLNRIKICEAILKNVSREQLKKELLTQKSTISHKNTTISHKNTTISRKTYSCNYCEKQFSRNDSLQRHINTTCKEKKKQDTKDELIEMKFLKKELEKKEKEIEKKDKIIAGIAQQPKTNYKIQQKIDTMNNLTLEKMQEHADKLTIDHIKQGADGYAQYALNHPLKDSLVCTDYARRKVVYKNASGERENDPKMTKTLQMLGESINNRNTQLIDDERKLLALENKYNLWVLL